MGDKEGEQLSNPDVILDEFVKIPLLPGESVVKPV
jgi:hypothetical protein